MLLLSSFESLTLGGVFLGLKNNLKNFGNKKNSRLFSKIFNKWFYEFMAMSRNENFFRWHKSQYLCIQGTANQLNRLYSWPAEEFVQLVCRYLYSSKIIENYDFWCFFDIFVLERVIRIPENWKILNITMSIYSKFCYLSKGQKLKTGQKKLFFGDTL